MDAGREFDVFFSNFSRDWITGRDTIFDVEVCGFADVADCLITRVALRNTAGQGWHDGYISTVFFSFQDYGIAHEESPLTLIIAANTDREAVRGALRIDEKIK